MTGMDGGCLVGSRRPLTHLWPLPCESAVQRFRIPGERREMALTSTFVVSCCPLLSPRFRPVAAPARPTPRYQQAMLYGWILGKRNPPLRLPKPRSEIRRKEHRDAPVGLLGSLLHLVYEVAAGPEVPSLQHRGEAGRL
jgi:hypothetical protein